MIQAGTSLVVADKSGVAVVECIKVLGSSKWSIASLGDVVLVSVKKVNLLRLAALKKSRQKRVSKGKLHRALIIRTKVFYRRFQSVFVKFDENNAILVNKQTVPTSNRVYGPVLKELCMRYSSLGCISRYII